MFRTYPSLLWIAALGIALAQQPRDIRVTHRNEEIALKTAPGSVPRSYALVIGIAQYLNLGRTQWLHYSEQDSDAIYATLISPQGGSFRAENVHKLSGPSATLKNIRYELETWLPSVAQDADRVLIYFAGHGFVRQGRGYLGPFDLDPTHVAETGYPMDSLGQVIGARIRSRWKVLLTDTCHSGAITPDSLTINSALRDLGKSLFSLTASRDRELSYEGDVWGGGHGVFTYYVVEGLKGAADETGDGIVTADELAEYVHYHVRKSVREMHNAPQSPTFDRGSSFDPNMPLSFPGITGPKAGRESRFGGLVFTSNTDDVDIYVDEELKGTARKEAPLAIPGLPIGAHVVKGVKMGYEPDGPREETVYPDQTTTVTIRILYPRQRDKRSMLLLENGVREYQKGYADNYRKAVQHFQEALALDANYSQAALYLARAHRDLFEYDDARKYFRRAIEIDPDYLEGRTSYAGMLLDLSDTDEAIRQLTFVIQRDRLQVTAHYLLAQAFNLKGRYDVSIEEARTAISLQPNSAEAHFFLAEGLKMSHHCDQANAEYLAYLRLSDYNSGVAGKLNYYVGGYLLGYGKKKRASQQDVWKDLRYIAYAGLGDCERVTSHPDQAISFYREALRYGNDARVQFAMGVAFTSKAEIANNVAALPAALLHFREAVKINPDLDESRQARKYITLIERQLNVQRN